MYSNSNLILFLMYFFIYIFDLLVNITSSPLSFLFVFGCAESSLQPYRFFPVAVHKLTEVVAQLSSSASM